MTETLNELLLRGARRHDRDGVFVVRENDAWVSTPDWRADRHSIRIALALQERYGVEPGDAVALGIELVPEWPLIERALWGLTAISIPCSDRARLRAVTPVVVFATEAPADVPDSVRGVVTLGDSYRDLLEHGGVLDTPERATRFRAAARQTPPEALASIEDEGRTEASHGEWTDAVEAFREQRDRGGETLLLESRAPTMEARVAIYSAWSDGISRVAFADPGGSGPDGSVSLRREEP